MVTYSSEEMEAIKVQCDIYVSKMKQIANQISTSREEMKARAEKAKQDLIRKAREVAERELKEYQGIIYTTAEGFLPFPMFMVGREESGQNFQLFHALRLSY